MASIRVPPRAVEEFKVLADLDDATFERLATAVDAAAPRLAIHLLWKQIAESGDLDLTMVESVLEAVLIATTIGNRDGIRSDEIGRSLRFEDQSVDTAALTPRVARLVESDAIYLSAKALDLLASEERITVRSKVITDARPVFRARGEEEPGQPAAAIVTHTLQVEYIENGETRTFYASMDRVDLPRLRDEIDRAEAKAASLTAFIEGTGARTLHVEREDEGQVEPVVPS
jgi:hypothetical protein